MVAAAPTPAVGGGFVFTAFFVRAFVFFVVAVLVLLVLVASNSSEEDEEDVVVSCIIVPVVRFDSIRFDSMDLHLPICYAAAAAAGVFNFRSSALVSAFLWNTIMENTVLMESTRRSSQSFVVSSCIVVWKFIHFFTASHRCQLRQS